MAGSPCGLCRRLLVAWIVAVVAVLAPGRATAAPEVETRDFTVFVDGKPSGDVHMTLNKQEDGSIIVTCDTDINVAIGIGPLKKKFTYSYRGREVWKTGKLQRFDSNCNDDGKRCAVGAVIEDDKLRVRVNSDEKLVPGTVWLSSYWSMPDNDRINQTVGILEADTGLLLSSKVQFMGVEQRTIAGQAQKVNHFRLLGRGQVDLWYDVSGRLVSQDWVEEGHRTQVELNRLRR